VSAPVEACFTKPKMGVGFMRTRPAVASSAQSPDIEALLTGVAAPNATMDWPTEMAAGVAISAGDVPPLTTLVSGPIVTWTLPRAKCAPSLLRTTVAPRTVSTSPLRAITSPSTVSTPAPGTLVPAWTIVASNSRVCVVKVPNATVAVPSPAAVSAARPAPPM
jgi:hypothetical protein